MASEDSVETLYRQRFRGLQKKRNGVWRVLCAYFARFISPGSSVLDVACGYGEFLNNLKEIRPDCKLLGADINPDSQKCLRKGITFIHSSVESVVLPDSSLDLVFASNFFEHLENSKVFLSVLKNITRMLKPNGCLMVLQPDLKLCGATYWDFLDHKFPVTVPRMIEATCLVGMCPEKIVRRFLPYTMSSRQPAHPFLVKLYIMLMPFSGWLFGKQFFALFRKTEVEAISSGEGE